MAWPSGSLYFKGVRKGSSVSLSTVYHPLIMGILTDMRSAYINYAIVAFVEQEKRQAGQSISDVTVQL